MALAVTSAERTSKILAATEKNRAHKASDDCKDVALRAVIGLGDLCLDDGPKRIYPPVESSTVGEPQNETTLTEKKERGTKSQMTDITLSLSPRNRTLVWLATLVLQVTHSHASRTNCTLVPRMHKM